MPVSESENAVLSVCMKNIHAMHIALEQLEDTNFSMAGEIIFKTIRELRDKQFPVSVPSVRQLLQQRNELELIGGINYLVMLSGLYPNAEEIDTYVYLLREHSVKYYSGEILKTTYSELQTSDKPPSEVVQEGITKLSKTAVVLKEAGYQEKEQIEVELEWARMRDYMANPKEYARWPFAGIPLVNACLFNGKLVILAGAAATGKTTVMLKTAWELAKRGFKIDYVALEMTRAQLYARLYRYDKGEDLISIHDPQQEISKAHLQKIQTSGLRVHTTDGGYDNADKLIAALYRMKYEESTVCFIDYLGLVRLRENRNLTLATAIGELTREFQRITKKLKYTIVLGCQYNRGVAHGNRPPTMSDLRDSGHIENDAEDVILLDRPALREARSKGQTTVDATDNLRWIHAKSRDSSAWSGDITWSQRYNGPSLV